MNKQSGRKALGRGLSALIPTQNEEKGSDNEIVQVDITSIHANPFQPRTEFSDDEIRDLASSIETQGLLQPVVLRKSGNHYDIISGERRFRAFKFLKRDKVPCIVRPKVSDREMLELALVENIQREELNEIEKAVAYQKLLLDYSYTHDQLAKQVGKSRTAISNALRLLNLPEEIQAMVRGNSLTMGHARALLSIEGSERQKDLAKKIVDENLSVRDIERVTQAGKEKKAVKKAASDEQHPDANLQHQIEKLQYKFGTSVKVLQNSKDKGKVEIEFYNKEDLVRIFDLLLAE